MLTKSNKIVFSILSMVVLISSLIGGCASVGSEHKVGEQTSDITSIENLPLQVTNAPTVVQKAYQFALANPEILKQIPCYCGCGAMGHTSNYSCYISDAEEADQIQFDYHALGCSICVDITLDTIQQLDQGKEIGEIFIYIETTYSRFGPSNID